MVAATPSSRRQRHALRMVARRSGDHPACFLRIAQLHQFVVGATDLEGERWLQVLALEQNPIAQRLGQRWRRLQRRTHGDVVDRRGEDLFHVLLKQGLLVRAVFHRHLRALCAGAAEGCDLLTLFFPNQKQDQKIAAFGSSYREHSLVKPRRQKMKTRL